MHTGPSNPTRTLAATLAVLQVPTTIGGLVQQAMWPMFDDPTILLAWMNVFWGATAVTMHALLIGLVLSCDRRIAPAIALFVWLALSPLTHIPVWLPELPRAASFAAWLLHELSWLSVIAAVAFVQARRVVFVLGGLSASFVLLAIGMGLGWAEVDARAVRMVLTLFRGCTLAGVFAFIALDASPAARKHAGWPLALLGLLPFLRLWFALNARLEQGPYSFEPWRMTRLAGMEAAFLVLLVLAFVGVSRRNTNVVPFFSALSVSTALSVAAGGLAWLVSSDWQWQREYGDLLFGLAVGVVLSSLAVLFVQIRTLAALAAHLKSERLVARADATTGAYAAVIVCSAFLVLGSFALSPRDPLFAVLVGLLGLCVLIGSLVALGLWVFLCFGLARRLDQEEPTEDMYAG
jgi:hypothetical protein